jgi:hypothetical protein
MPSPKVYKITLKDMTGVPKSLTVPRLKVTYHRGRPRTTPSQDEVRYARKRPHQFAVEVLKAPRPVPPPEYADVTDDDLDEGTDEQVETNPIEEWLDLTGEAENGEPKNNEIKDFAKKYEIDLDGATRKDDMMSAVETWLNDRATG